MPQSQPNDGNNNGNVPKPVDKIQGMFMTDYVGSYEAKTKLPELLRRVSNGNTVTITNRGEPVAKIVQSDEQHDRQVSTAIDNIKALKAPTLAPSMFKKMIDEASR